MNERLKELAEQAGLRQLPFERNKSIYLANDSELERFAELVRQDEHEITLTVYEMLLIREACAKLLETQIDFKGLDSQPQFLKFALDLITGCANLIRARGEKNGP